MSHLGASALGVVAWVLGIAAIVAVCIRLQDGREEHPVVPAAPGTPGTPDPGSSAPPRALPALAIALMLIGAILAGVIHAVLHSAPRHTIRFHPGQYVRIPFTSGPALSAAMKAVNTASDPAMLTAALAAVERMVDAGDAEAAFRLGRYYHLETTQPDYALALKYYRIAFDRNHAWATNNIGLLYRDGLGVVQDENLAHKFFERAAALGSSWAYLNLADMDFQAPGAARNSPGGIAWLEKGGHDNCTACLIEEAAIYHVGAYGLRIDRAKTVIALEKAAALGDDEAKLILAEMRIVGDQVPQSSTAASKMLQALSADGDADASVLLGELSSDDKIRDYLFESALGGLNNIPADLTAAFPRDTGLSIRYWERANQQGSCQSWIDLSSLFDRGIGVKLDRQKAADDVKQAVACDPTNGFYLWKLGARYYDARGVDRDCETALRLYGQAFLDGYADAAVDLGYVYDKGCGPIARDDRRAFQLYLLGAKMGVALCQNNVGVMIKHGRGVPSADLARGYGWIKLAALHGDELAKANLQDPVFTVEIRARGLADLADIQRRLLTVPPDPQDILHDPWY